jgi:glycosyltransferase involved in cell wall biosynthesis
MSRNRRPTICFVAHYAYGAMAGGHRGHIGGVERQTSLMARWFAGRGYTVSMLTCDEGQKDETVIDGVRILTMYRAGSGIRGLRFIWPKWTALNAAMNRADADLYYQNCAECVTGQTASWCLRHDRKFVFSVANDPDCDKRLPDLHTRHERVLYRYGLRAAHQIIVQTRRQQEMMRDSFGRDSAVLPMPCPGPSEDEYAKSGHCDHRSRRVLWIGRICEQKRPDRLLDLADACPDISFDFVGPAMDSEYSRRICTRAEATRNVVWHGPASRERVSEFFRNARVLCCTSDYEGFPNTFLEAWSHGLPIVSTFDPDNTILERGVGRVAKNLAELSAGLRSLLDQPDSWQHASHVAREYYVQNHSMDIAMQRFEQIFRNVAGVVSHGDSGCHA